MFMEFTRQSLGPQFSTDHELAWKKFTEHFLRVVEEVSKGASQREKEPHSHHDETSQRQLPNDQSGLNDTNNYTNDNHSVELGSQCSEK